MLALQSVQRVPTGSQDPDPSFWRTPSYTPLTRVLGSAHSIIKSAGSLASRILLEMARTLLPGNLFLLTRSDRTHSCSVLSQRPAKHSASDGTVSPNMFAAGEIMAGNVLGEGYLAGIGMTIGSVFGRLAGEGAARYVRN